MKRVLVHASLLVAMMVLAFFTWTAGDAGETDESLDVVWEHDEEDIVGLSYTSGTHNLEVERRGEGEGAHLWAVQTETTPLPVPDSVAADSMAGPVVSEFPVGDAGETLIDGLARLGVTRDLGEATEEKRTTYGISDTVPVLTIRLRDGEEQVLALGATVVGGGGRYVQDLGRNRIYVLPAGLLRPVEMGGDMLRLSSLQDFEPDEVAAARVQAAAAERIMRRVMQGNPPREVWTAPESDRADQAFGNFMDQVDRLWITDYVTDASADTLRRIVRVEYLDADNDVIGFLELYRTTDTGDAPIYLMRTGRTVVFGEVYPALAERVEQDVSTMFGSAARTEAPQL